jgi:predicted MFS family arabinose efflux permease
MATLDTAVPIRPARPLWVVILAAGTIVGLAMGLRQVMGLYLKPISTELGFGREPFSNAMAIANLTWGVLTILAGAVADKYGAGRVLVVCALATVSSFYLLATAQTPFDLYVAGLLAGAGVAGTGVPALVGAVGRAAPIEKRTAAIASLGMASGIGNLIAFPYAHILIETIGWKASLMAIAATCLMILPLAWPLAGKPAAHSGPTKSQSLVEAFQEAFAHPSFWLLVSGFFVCGFHLAFYGVHLPAFVSDLGMPSWVGVWALMAVGIANIIGTYSAGQSAKFIERRVGLSIIYFMRSFAFLGLLFLPLSPWLIIAVSALLGLFWLSTVPLTSSLVGIFFGTQWMSMLFGFVFLSHQLGSFTGLWLAGKVYDATKSYDMMWWISIALALFAALIHLPIRERPVARLAAQPAT